MNRTEINYCIILHFYAGGVRFIDGNSMVYSCNPIAMDLVITKISKNLFQTVNGQSDFLKVANSWGIP
jgi:hypothetical protein